MKTKIQLLFVSDSKFVANAKDIITILGFLLSIAWNTNCFGQDIITYKNGDELKVKVTEVAPTEIQFKKFDNPDGPVYTEPRTNIFMIKYENGSKEVFSDKEEVSKPAAENNNVVDYSSPDRSGNTDLIETRDGTKIVCKIGKINSNMIYYHVFRHGMDSNESISLTNVKAFTTDYKDQKGITPSCKTQKSETTTDDDFLPEARKYGGPRVGFTIVGDGAFADALETEGKRTVFSQFGWQFEKRLFTLKNGPSGMLEFVPMIGGLDMGKIIPSVSVLLGVRTKKGLEFGAGPNLSIYAGRDKTGMYQVSPNLGIVIAMGMSIKYGKIYFPVNLALVPSITQQATVYDPNTGGNVQKNYETGFKVSLLFGFNNRTK